MPDYKDILDLERILSTAHLNTRYLYDDLYNFFKPRIMPELTEVEAEEIRDEAYNDGYNEGMEGYSWLIYDLVAKAKRMHSIDKTDTDVLNYVLTRLEDGV